MLAIPILKLVTPIPERIKTMAWDDVLMFKKEHFHLFLMPLTDVHEQFLLAALLKNKLSLHIFFIRFFFIGRFIGSFIVTVNLSLGLVTITILLTKIMILLFLLSVVVQLNAQLA